jgi:hypothetical protein
MRKIDAILRLFDGDITLTELVKMDFPSQRALVQSRIMNLKESMERYEKEGKVDFYSKGYASILGGISGSSPQDEQTPDNKPIIRNLRDKRVL